MRARPDGDAALIPGRSSILSRAENWARHVDVEVPGTRLDAEFALGIGVTGAARQVLLGAEGLLPRVASLMIEIEARRFRQDQWLYSDVCAHLPGKGLRPVARDCEDEHQFSAVFVNAAASARLTALAAGG